jgi:hypothetical protein
VSSVRRRDGLLVLALGLAVRLAVVAWAAGRFPPVADGTFYHRLAERIVSGEGYTWLWPDGAVTHAAHYPIGYPALLALAYFVGGVHPAAAMVVNAALGALAGAAAHGLVAHHRSRGAALGAGLMVALHPGLVGYTPALMTEGAAAALFACAAWIAAAARRTHGSRRWLGVAGTGLVVGLATLVRPESLLTAPFLGWAAAPKPPRQGVRRWFALGAALLSSAMAVAVCLPWTARNCARMGRCALVSVNGGWNLLIGTDARGEGGWAPLDVPVECREVYDEAAKDSCFERAALARVKADPRGWLALAPAKLDGTFDYCGAAGWYLDTANPAAFGAGARRALGTVEIVYERALLLLALSACWPGRRRRGLRWWASAILTGAGVAGALSTHAATGYLALALLALSRRRAQPCWTAAAAVVLCTALTRVVFFGGGRYQLVIWAVMGPLAALGAWRLASLLRRSRRAAVQPR